MSGLLRFKTIEFITCVKILIPEEHKMKMLLVCFLSLLLVFNVFAAPKKTDWERDELKGKVKESVRIDYAIKNKAGEDIKEIDSKSISKYDARGNQIESAEYESSGDLKSKRIFKYDAKGNNIELADYGSNGDLKSKTISKYDAKGNEIESAAYKADGALDYKLTIINKYDTKGNRIEEATYDAEGFLTKTIYKYDARGNQIEQADYVAGGSLSSKIIDKYDDKDNQIEGAVYYKGEALQSKFTCKYDAKGNQIEVAGYKEDGVSDGKSISKYDSKGNKIEEAQYKADGTSGGKSTYKYDDKGNKIEWATYDEEGKLSKIRISSYTYYGDERGPLAEDKTDVKIEGFEQYLQQELDSAAKFDLKKAEREICTEFKIDDVPQAPDNTVSKAETKKKIDELVKQKTDEKFPASFKKEIHAAAKEKFKTVQIGDEVTVQIVNAFYKDRVDRYTGKFQADKGTSLIIGGKTILKTSLLEQDLKKFDNSKAGELQMQYMKENYTIPRTKYSQQVREEISQKEDLYGTFMTAIKSKEKKHIQSENRKALNSAISKYLNNEDRLIADEPDQSRKSSMLVSMNETIISSIKKLGIDMGGDVERDVGQILKNSGIYRELTQNADASEVLEENKSDVKIPADFEIVKGSTSDTNGWASEIRHKTTGIKMVYVAPGEFTMGSPDSVKDRNALDFETPHKVKLTKGYYIGKYEVTQEQWKKVMGNNPSKFKGVKQPVEQICRDDCKAFCKKLGSGFRLPTEAEWEYAARGGNRTKGFIYSGSNDPDGVAWFNNNSRKTTHPVGQKEPNELGIYDMSGNVFEWCSDWFGDYPTGSVSDPVGASVDRVWSHGEWKEMPLAGGRIDSVTKCVFRGGCWAGNEMGCRSFQRAGYGPSLSCDSVGFRLTMDIPIQSATSATGTNDIEKKNIRLENETPDLPPPETVKNLNVKELTKKAEDEWTKISNSFPGIDGDQGYKPALWHMKSSDVDILLAKDLGGKQTGDVKIIKMAAPGAIECVELHFSHGYFYKVVTKYRIAKTAEEMYRIAQKIKDIYGETDQEKEAKLMPVEGDENSAKPAEAKPKGEETHVEEPPPAEVTFTWTGKITKGSLYYKRNPDGSLSEMIFTKEIPKVVEGKNIRLEDEKKKNEKEEKEKELELYKKYNN